MTNETILVVEDDAVQREGLALLLREEGYTVLTAADGQETLHSLRNDPTPDLILLDMLMPVHDGWRFLKERTWSRLASIPVVIVTSLGNASHEWAASLGAAGFLRKPFDVEPLLTEIRRCCQMARSGGPQLASG
jgi:two-component system response regulator MprA